MHAAAVGQQNLAQQHTSTRPAVQRYTARAHQTLVGSVGTVRTVGNVPWENAGYRNGPQERSQGDLEIALEWERRERWE